MRGLAGNPNSFSLSPCTYKLLTMHVQGVLHCQKCYGRREAVFDTLHKVFDFVWMLDAKCQRTVLYCETKQKSTPMQHSMLVTGY